jgi:hypothetical protein
MAHSRSSISDVANFAVNKHLLDEVMDMDKSVAYLLRFFPEWKEAELRTLLNQLQLDGYLGN